MEESFTKLGSAKIFFIFYLKDAYLQQLVDNETNEILTIKSHKYYNMLRLAFGVKCATGIFQVKVKYILIKFYHVGASLDDVIIRAKSKSENSGRVESILKCFSEHNI